MTMIRICNRLFDTHPIAAHCPGPPYDGFTRFHDAVLGQSPKPMRGCSDLTILTWNAGLRPAKPTGLLERILERFGVSPWVLGKGTPNWQNIYKIRLTADALEAVTTPFVMGADSSDVVVFDDPAVFVDRFKQHFTSELVFNATGAECWPELPEYVHF